MDINQISFFAALYRVNEDGRDVKRHCTELSIIIHHHRGHHVSVVGFLQTRLLLILFTERKKKQNWKFAIHWVFRHCAGVTDNVPNVKNIVAANRKNRYRFQGSPRVIDLVDQILIRSISYKTKV